MYAISTKFGMIPHVCTSEYTSLQKPRILYVDDFIYKGSIFDHQDITLRQFCSIPEDIKILLLFKTQRVTKNRVNRIITSKRGNKTLHIDEYEKLVKILDPDFYQDFLTENEIVSRSNEKMKVLDFNELDEFNTALYNTYCTSTMSCSVVECKEKKSKCVCKDKESKCEQSHKKKDVIFGTTFINKITDEGMMSKSENKKLVIADDIFDCDCCGNLSKGYLKHLKEMKEINFYTMLTKHNYNTLERLLSSL